MCVLVVVTLVQVVCDVGELVVDDVEDQAWVDAEVLVDDDMFLRPAIEAQGISGRACRVSTGRARTVSPMTARFRRTAS